MIFNLRNILVLSFLHIVKSDFIKIFQNLIDANNFKNIVIYQPQYWYNFDDIFGTIIHNNIIPKLIINQQINLKLYEHFNGNIFVLVAVNKNSKEILNTNGSYFEALDKTLNSIHHVKIIFYLDYVIKSLTKIEWLFLWCWQHKFLNVIAYFWEENFQSNNKTEYKIASYNPYPNLKIYYLDYNDVGKLYPNKVRNLQGYKLRMKKNYDPPRSINYTDEKTQKIIYSGRNIQLYTEYYQYLNATNTDQFVYEYGNLTEHLQLLETEKIHFTNMQFQNLYVDFNKDIITFTKVVIDGGYYFMVPYSQEIPMYLYFLKPFTIETWLCIFVAIFYLVLITEILRFFYYRKFELGRSFIDSLALILCISFQPDHYNITVTNVIIFIQVTILGFILSNYYLTKLSSFLTSRLFTKQLNTFDDIIEAKISILISRSQKTVLFDDFSSFSQKFRDLFVLVESQIYLEHKNRLDTKFCYATLWDAGQTTLKQQTHLLRPLFKIIPKVMNPAKLLFLIHIDSPFKDSLNKFITYTFEAGIMTKKWIYDVEVLMFKAKYFNYLQPEDFEMPDGRILLSVKHFSLAMYLIVIGNFISFLVFIIEIFAKKFSKK